MEDKQQEIINAIKKIIEVRKNPVLVLDLKEIKKIDLLVIHELLCKKSFDSFDVILQTPGGDIDAAFLIAKLLRKKAKKVNIIVPLFAKSAGTLICLSADQIILTDLSELGPLDTQVLEREEGRRKYTSALNEFKALEQVQLHTIETLDIATKLILSRSDIGISEAIHLATEFSGQTSGTLYSKLSPHKIGEYARALEIGEQYGIMLLTRHRGWSKENAEKTVKTLVKQYPSHNFIIDLEELTKLGLPASEIETDLLDTVLFIRKKFLETQQSLIKIVEPEKGLEIEDEKSKNQK